MRSVVFRYESVAALSAALAEARPVVRAPATARSRRGSDSNAPPPSMRGGESAIPLPEGETVAEGEWVVATFEFGQPRRATACTARGVKLDDAIWLEFERRDWDRLQGFVVAKSEHMRASKPVPQSTAAIPVAIPVLPPIEDLADAPPRSRRFDDLPPSSVLESTRVPFGAKVLVVDDDKESAEEVQRMLTEAGLVVELVATAIGAEERMRVQTFDALVLDLHVPGLDSRELVTRLRADPRSANADIPVLFLSSRPTSRDAVDAFASGADDFLPKPFRPTELAARIFGLLRRARLVRAVQR